MNSVTRTLAELVKVEIDGAEWPHTIDGVDIQEYFEGLIFAG